MRFLYGIGMVFLFAVMWMASLFNAKAKKWIAGRRNAFTAPFDTKQSKVAWFHCASLGEFDQGLPVMNAYKEKFPDSFILVTFFSPSGMDNYHKRDHKVDLAVYLPLDTRRNAVKFINRFKPEHVFFVKYEFWYNHLKAVKENGSKVFGVSTLFRPTHRFFKWYGGFFRKALRLFDHIYVQDKRSAELLKSIGVSEFTIAGDTRYDRMLAVKEKNSGNEKIERFKGKDKLIILGSSWPVDEDLFRPYWNELTRDYKILIAPHDISEEHITGIESNLPVPFVRYTDFTNQDVRIMIVNTIGQLTSSYLYGDLAYVGGGFTGKLHNILEPGAFGLPIIFGPKHERFPEAELFIERGVAVSLEHKNDLLPAIESLVCRQTKIASELEGIFRENSGAADMVTKTL